MSHQQESNPQPTHYKCVALPIELWWQIIIDERKKLPDNVSGVYVIHPY
jgi:hypothetical protein